MGQDHLTNPTPPLLLIQETASAQARDRHKYIENLLAILSLEQEREIVGSSKFTWSLTETEQPHRPFADERQFAVFDQEHAAFAQTGHIHALIGGDILLDAHLAGFARMAVGMSVQIVGVDLERDQVQRLERQRLDNGKVLPPPTTIACAWRTASAGLT